MNFLKKKKPDAIVLFGDRFEILSIANVCFLHKIPIIHIGGGETTEGSSDELFVMPFLNFQVFIL